MTRKAKSLVKWGAALVFCIAARHLVFWRDCSTVNDSRGQPVSSARMAATPPSPSLKIAAPTTPRVGTSETDLMRYTAAGQLLGVLHLGEPDRYSPEGVAVLRPEDATKINKEAYQCIFKVLRAVVDSDPKLRSAVLEWLHLLYRVNYPEGNSSMLRTAQVWRSMLESVWQRSDEQTLRLLHRRDLRSTPEWRNAILFLWAEASKGRIQEPAIQSGLMMISGSAMTPDFANDTLSEVAAILNITDVLRESSKSAN
jgi:hypothetical protein